MEPSILQKQVVYLKRLIRNNEILESMNKLTKNKI